jgi:large subunit ribosomal protein L15
MITLSNLKPFPYSRKRKKRVGRGNSSGHGTYSGRGQKGQRSRAGGRKGLKLKGLKPIIKRIPKLGGFKSIRPRKYYPLNLSLLEKLAREGNVQIKPLLLLKKGIIRNPKEQIKILGRGKITKKITVYAHAFSKSAETAIKKAGGAIVKISS